jgi:hypothetical protein
MNVRQMVQSFGLCLAIGVLPSSLAKESRGAPPNTAATVEVKGNKLTVRYDGQMLFTGEVGSSGASFHHNVAITKVGERLQQVIQLTSLDRGKPLRIVGNVLGSNESFPCEADRQNRGPLMVRHVSGLSRSLLNRAVYDRQRDWVLSVDANPSVHITPKVSADGKNSFTLEIEGREIILRFRPRYFQQHRGLKYFEPWRYQVWPHSVAGWISWFAFFDQVTEKDVIETADVFSEKLLPFGYEYFQIDDGYQRGKGDPELWLKPNSKFPNGLKFLADHIKSKGLKPGLWTAATVDQKEYVDAHPAWFVRKSDGTAAWGNWINYILDASNKDALDHVVAPLYRGLRQQGWEYYKVDALRHLRYEGYNAYQDFFKSKSIGLVETYRKYMQAARDEIGREHFVLGCWGIRPELVGLIDGCRIGDDGFAYAGLSQYNSFNNIVWRNDPDHIELNEDAYRSTMVTSLTGSLFMLTDKPAVYQTEKIEPAKRTVPVLFTTPGQIFDVDPSRSDELGRVDAEVSGSGPRPFDAGYTPNCHLYLLEVIRPFESWCVLGRTGGDQREIRFADLGLDATKEFFVIEFWTKKLLGVFRTSFDPGPIDKTFRSQAFCIRERQRNPQLLATSRHITAGGVDLIDVGWSEQALAGRSTLVAGDPYVLYLTEPNGFTFDRLSCSGAAVEKTERDGSLVKATLRSDNNGTVQWRAQFAATTLVR